MKRRLIVIVIVLAIVGFSAFYGLRQLSSSRTATEDTSPSTGKPSMTADDQSGFDKKKYSLTDPSSLWVIANKSHALPADYQPSDLAQPSVTLMTNKSRDEMSVRTFVADQLENLIDAATKEGINLKLASGFRSYQLQQTYYNSYVRSYGQAEADRFSARPGTSEHQTGLAVDVATIGSGCYLEVCFADEPGGKWVANHAHEYGFIVRYPEGKENITGYTYEPWHLRYVGAELAQAVTQRNQTLEEFFDISK